jgi:hypothetical protein
MRIEELEVMCREAAEQIVAREGRPVVPAIVLPLPDATRVVALPDFPDADDDRLAVLTRFAEDEMRPANAAAYGFLAEATAEAEGGGVVEVLVAVYGARNHHPQIVAGPLDGDGLGPFTEAEPVAPSAMPFLAPLQRAADAARPPDAMPMG